MSGLPFFPLCPGPAFEADEIAVRVSQRTDCFDERGPERLAGAIAAKTGSTGELARAGRTASAGAAPNRASARRGGTDSWYRFGQP